MFAFITVSGNIGQDAKRRTFGNGGGYVSFSVPGNKSVPSNQSDNGWRKLTEWYEVRIDLRRAKFAEYIEAQAKSGRAVEVRGELRSSSYTAEGEARPRTYWYIDPQEIEFKGKGRQNDQHQGDEPPPYDESYL